MFVHHLIQTQRTATITNRFNILQYFMVYVLKSSGSRVFFTHVAYYYYIPITNKYTSLIYDENRYKKS